MKPILTYETPLTAEQSKALDLMLDGKNVFLTGEAGTGKSFVLAEFRKLCAQRNIVFLAPTGIAASNIKGQTIHSFCRLKYGLQSKDTLEDITDGRHINLLNAVQTIVIDEISMVRADVFAAIDYRFRKAAGEADYTRPFAGKQVIVCGDFFQLPPIISTAEELQYLESANAKCLFTTKCWQDVNFHCIVLKKIHRQADDKLFQDILHNIRRGTTDTRNILLPNHNQPVSSITALNELCYHGKKPVNRTNAICLCTTRKEAEMVNQKYASALNSKVEIFKAQVTGIFTENQYPTEANLRLQENARVMTLANKRNADGTFEYVNGDLGYITTISRDDEGIGQVMVRFDDGRESLLEPTKWPMYQYEYEKDLNTGEDIIKQLEVGSFTQIPLRLAWAITIHKSQGMGFDEVLIRLGNGCFAEGQLYTAISRCRSLKGLHLHKRTYKQDVFCNEEVIKYYNQLEQCNTSQCA